MASSRNDAAARLGAFVVRKVSEVRQKGRALFAPTWFVPGSNPPDAGLG
jgi:hypothetical protein